MSLKQILPVPNEPDFLRFIDNFKGGGKKLTDMNGIIQEIFIVAAERGLNEHEFSRLVNVFLEGSMGLVFVKKLLPNLVPSSMAPSPIMKKLMVWFISSYEKKISKDLSICILQWLIGLLENDLIDPDVFHIFYYDFYRMLDYNKLVKYACKLLCILTKPRDVTASEVTFVSNKLKYGNEEKYLLAVLNVFKGYKPRLMLEDVKRVEVSQVLKTVPQKMESLMKLVSRKHRKIHAPYPGVFEVPVQNSRIMGEGLYKTCSLTPYPIFSLEGLGNLATCYSNSIVETFREFNRVPIPQNIMSLLRDETGFFLITHLKPDIQKRLELRLIRTLQSVFIDQETVASESDKELLLSRVYHLEMFMQQGLQCVSMFLAGYLLNWDGLDYRPLILSLIEWASFKSFQDLNANILRPLYMLFVTTNVTMKKQIIRTVTHLIRNMFSAEVGRVTRGIPYPFMDETPAWTSNLLNMLSPLVEWAERLIKIGLCVEPKDSTLLMECVRFYEMMNVLEMRNNLPMWTVLSRGVIFHSVFNLTPVALNRVCRLLLRYHKDFLPQLRLKQPEFYNECSDKINLTSKYAQELINLLWNGQAFSRKEDGVLLNIIPQQTFENLNLEVDVDSLFDLAHNINFLPYIMLERQKNGPGFLQTKEDFFALVEFHLEDVAAFIKHFTPSFQTP